MTAYIDGLMQDCSNSSALRMLLQQPFTKLSTLHLVNILRSEIIPSRVSDWVMFKTVSIVSCVFTTKPAKNPISLDDKICPKRNLIALTKWYHIAARGHCLLQVLDVICNQWSNSITCLVKCYMTWVWCAWNGSLFDWYTASPLFSCFMRDDGRVR